MSFWQSLVESYEANEEALQKEFPLSSTSISNNADDIVIVQIDGDGNYLGSDKIEKRKGSDELINVSFPVSEGSLGRAGKATKDNIFPHPVFDQFEYLSGTGEKFETYLSNLKNIVESPFTIASINAIYAYISKRKICDDLKDLNLSDKINILFEIQIPGENQIRTWEDENLFNAWHQYYLSLKQEDDSDLDFITGKEQVSAKAHPKKISNGSGNAKLISANDSSNYTFRGRFTNSDEALSMGYESSQKAHQFLRFLVRDRPIIAGEQVILTYQIGRKNAPILNPLDGSKRSFDFLHEISEPSVEEKLGADTGSDFANKLRDAILLGRQTKNYKQHQKTAIIILDAATTGRLSVKYYQELDDGDYLEKIINWHESCKFNLFYYDDKHLKHHYIGTPSVDKIIQAVYGKPKSASDEGYKKLKKIARERLIHCIFDGETMPRDYVRAAVRRASVPLANEGNFDELVAITCAMVKKYEKEVYDLSLERELTKRDYLFGRLLGAADSLESYVNYKSGNDRTTTALRYMNAFSQKPFKTWKIIRESLNPYIQSFKGHKNLALSEIEEIETLFSIADFENDTALKGTYLLGYSCEKAWIIQEVRNLSKNKTQSEEEK